MRLHWQIGCGRSHSCVSCSKRRSIWFNTRESSPRHNYWVSHHWWGRILLCLWWSRHKDTCHNEAPDIDGMNYENIPILCTLFFLQNLRTSFKYSCKINGAFCYMTTWWCNSNLWASIVLNFCCMHMLRRLNTCTGIRLEIKFHPVSVDVVGLGCHLAGMHNLLCCLSTHARKLVIPNMIEMLMRQWCEYKP